mgnify:CR=1 FL=1
MAYHHHSSPEQQKKEAAEKVWLLYYNRVLYEKGLITERERNRMIRMIEQRYRPTGRL